MTLKSELLQTIVVVAERLKAQAETICDCGGAIDRKVAILRVLAEGDQRGLSQAQVGMAIGRSPALITRLIDELEAHGLVERRLHQFDRRLKVVHLTAQGRQRLEALKANHDLLAQTTFSDFDAACIQSFNTALSHLSRQLESDTGAGSGPRTKPLGAAASK